MLRLLLLFLLPLLLLFFFLVYSAFFFLHTFTAFYDLACKVVERNGGASKAKGSGETKLITLDNDTKKKKKKPCTIL